MRILAFDLESDGHNTSHLRLLIEYWLRERPPGHLGIAVSPRFAELQPDVIERARTSQDAAVEIIPVTDIKDNSEYELVHPGFRASRVAKAWRHWNLARTYVGRFRADHCLLMIFDRFQVPIAFDVARRRSFPAPFSSILFKPPNIHYASLGIADPTPPEAIKQLRRGVRQAKKRLYLSLAVRHRNLRHLYCTDRFAVPYLQERLPHVAWLPIPDAVRLSDSDPVVRESVRSELHVAPGRRLFLMFGVIGKHKGALQALSALELLPDAACATLAVAFVGRLVPELRREFLARVREVTGNRPIQMIVRDGWVPELDVQGYFQAADFVLTPYPDYVGMSGVVGLAASAGKPVLSSNAGLIGYLVRKRRLGITFNPQAAPEFSAAIERALTQPMDTYCDVAEMKRFARENSADAFATTLFDGILGPQND